MITGEEADGRSYVRRAMNKLAELGLAETNGKDGKHPIRNLTPDGQKALADGNELPPCPKVGTGAKAVRAGFGPHGIAVTDTILAYGSRLSLTDWQVEVNHAIQETGLSFNTDAVLARQVAREEEQRRALAAYYLGRVSAGGLGQVPRRPAPRVRPAGPG
ncbi:replication-relaxation family protein [Streptomyces sp. NPDC057543]|uniref:replication-relaxation family protein n=1 Tax=Streptomyces sp. NPDC057543 TaxID=3346163 RepID=UPI0036CE093F